MRTLALSLANTGRSCGRRMAETAGRFKPAVQHKLCGPCPSQMQIMEPLLVKAARSLEQQTEVIIGPASQAERLFNFVEFRSLMQIMERLSGDSGTILRTTDGGNSWVPQSSGTANMLFGVSFIDANTGTAVGGSCGIGGESTILRTTDGGGTWINQANPGTSLPFQSFAYRCQYRNRCRRRRPDSQNDQRRRYLVARKQAERPKLFMAFRSLTRITERFPVSSWAGPASFSERPMVETTGLSRQITRCLKEPTLFTPYLSPIRTRALLSATLGSSFKQPMEAPSGTVSQLPLSIFCTAFRLPMRTRELSVGYENPDGMILRTTDGGNSWVRQNSGIGDPFAGLNFFGVNFVNSNVGTMVGQEGIILRTTDGGNNWTQQTADTTDWLYAVQFHR